ncbi:MAG TPA: alpha-(1-_3)-arabinofuranosyltransferase family protein [Acidimicrobiia bacterium]
MSTTLTGSTTRAEAHPTSEPEADRLRFLGYAVLAAVAYVPILLTQRGRVVADTKSYLYLDPGRLLERAPSMWDPNIGLGTVTHQNIGYLFPMGPYYWLMHAVGVPAWVSQRLWFGTILFAAALGVLYLLRTLHVHGPGVVVAAFVFMLSPYVLDFAARLSVILLPWAGLPWMLALVIRALRDDGWAYPAVFAIVVQVVGSVNATALVFAGIVPVLWILYAVFVTREVAWRRAAGAVAKIAVLTLLTSLWWIVGLATQSAYGLDILRFTETLATVSHASLPSEVLRSLGYWFSYGGDKISAWIPPSVRYTQDLWAIAASYALPLLAFAAAGFVRWKHRAFFVLVLFVGFVIAVGANPYGDPSVLGGIFKSFAQSSSFGLALRSTARAVPLLALGTAVLLGLGVNALADAWSRRGLRVAGVAVAAAVIALAVVNVPALFDGSLYPDSLLRDENIPAYWTAAIAALDAQPHDTRILEVPGADFASYRWGGTVDPITPGLTDRPYVARELVPWGSPASADLLNAFDRRLQEGVLDPNAIAPIARLMSVGDVVYRADLQTDRFDLARATPVWQLFTQPRPNGLGRPQLFGLGATLPPLHYTQVDEQALAQAPDAAQPPPVSIFPVSGAPSIVHAASAQTPLVVSGDGEGLVDLAGLGALDPRDVVLYSGSFAGDDSALRRAVAQDGSVLVVTDSNRKRGRRWGAIENVEGPTERVDEQSLDTDEGDQRLDLFPGAGPSSETVVDSPHVEVSTTGIGNVITYWPEMRGSRAFDGDVDTAWEVGDHGSVIGETIRVQSDRPITTNHVNLVQPLVGPRERSITKATLRFDGGDPVSIDLGDASRTAAGQTFTFPKRTFHRLDITVDDTNVGDTFDYPTSNNVGFAEIRLRDDAPGSKDLRVSETVRMPTDLVDAAGTLATTRPLVYVMSRSRNEVIPPRYSQDEEALVRQYRVPNDRSFSWGGTARLATAAPDDVLDRALGIPDSTQGGITVRASQHLPGDIAARGSAAFDGDATTAWNTAFGAPVGQWVEVTTPAPMTVDSLDLRVVADGRHSVPTQIRIDGGGQSRTVDLAPVADQSAENATAAVPVSFAPLTGDTFRVTITAVRPVQTIEYHENQPIVMPVGIAEMGMPAVTRAAMPTQMPETCRDDLLAFDGTAHGVRLVGDTATAVAGGALQLQPCDASGTPTALALDRGDHVVASTPGTETGVDVDGLVLGSAADGSPMALGRGGSIAAFRAANRPSGAAPPRVEVVHDGRTKLELRVHGAQPGTPFWLVLGQSNNAGWKATVDGADATLTSGNGDGRSTLVDGYANGWLLEPNHGTFDVTLEWTPQRTVWIALAISGVALLGCFALAIVALRRRRSRAHDDPAVDGELDLGSPFAAFGTGVSTRATIVTAVAVALVAGAVSRWWVGLLVGAATAAALRVPRLRGALTVGAPLFVALTAGYVIVQQYRYRYPYEFFWVDHFTRAANLAWLAVLLLAADAVVELVRRRHAPPDTRVAAPAAASGATGPS